MISCEWCF